MQNLIDKAVQELIFAEVKPLRESIGNLTSSIARILERLDSLERSVHFAPVAVDQSVFDRLIALEDKVGNGYSIDELDEKISDLDNRIDDLESQIDDKVDADSVADAIDLDSIRDEVTNSATNNVLGRLIGAIQNAQD